MKKKLLTIASSLFVAALGAGALAACKKDSGNTPEPAPEHDETVYSVSFAEAAEGIEYSAGENVVSVKKGEKYSFSLKVSVFYTGTPVVKAGETVLEASDVDGKTYTYVIPAVRSDITVTAEGVEKAQSAMASSGSGTQDSPYLITEPIDLLYMADSINAGLASYVLGYYSLQNSIDFGGEELEIIGNGSTSTAFFAGFLQGNGYTLSDFVINSDEYDFVGLFGIVQGYSGNNISGGSIYNLNLDNFTVNATNRGTTLMCGSLVAQGFGANLTLCNATNGTVNVFGDYNHFSYAGGLIGMQRSYIYTDNAQFYSEVAYCGVDVDVYGNAGAVYTAGGIAGYVYSYDETTVSTIHHSYYTGKVTGSFYAGGIAGWLGNYTSVSTCYVSGDVNAQTSITDSDNSADYCYAYAGGIAGMAQTDSAIADCFATGKITSAAALGNKYAQKDGIAGRTEEPGAGAYGTHKASVFNCYYAEGGKNGETNLLSAEFQKEKLFWKDVDWKFSENGYPVVNTEPSSGYKFVVKLDFGENRVAGEDNTELSSISIDITDLYKPMCYWYNLVLESGEASIPQALAAKNGYVSYGYYFDKELTKAVPYGYVPVRDITYYVAFADYKKVRGEYYLIAQGDDGIAKTVRLQLNENGRYTCEDEYGEFTGTYVYNGETIVFYDGKFARYLSAYVSETAYQQAYDFEGRIESNGKLAIYGGLSTDESGNQTTIIASSSPMYAVKGEGSISGSFAAADGVYAFAPGGTGIIERDGKEIAFAYTLLGGALTIREEGKTDAVNGAYADGKLTIAGEEAKETDAFRGTWEILSQSRKYYTFDGAGNWEYEYYGYEYTNGGYSVAKKLGEGAGTYAAEGDGIRLSDGTFVFFGNDGFLYAEKDSKQVAFGREGSFAGKWNSADGKATLELSGIDKDGAGKASIVYTKQNRQGLTQQEFYDLKYYVNLFDESTVYLFYPDGTEKGGEFYGVLTFSKERGALSGKIFEIGEETSDFVSSVLYRTDEFDGEWIFAEPAFGIVDFNGYGNYLVSGGISSNGILKIDGTNVEYVLDSYTLSGHFVYKEKVYDISYDEASGKVSISCEGTSEELQRKDAFADRKFVNYDNEDVTYSFDGYGATTDGGKLKVKNGESEQTYVYKITASGADIYGADVDNKVGAISIENVGGRNFYRLSIDGAAVTLGEKTVFTGSWAVKAVYSKPLVIGLADADGKMAGKFAYSTETASTEGDVYITTRVADVLFTLEKGGYLSCEVKADSASEGTPYYVLNAGNGEFIVSNYVNWANYDSYGNASAADELFDEWTSKRGDVTYYFDGMGNDKYTIGMAYWSRSGDKATQYRYTRMASKKDGTECYIIYETVQQSDGSYAVSSARKVSVYELQGLSQEEKDNLPRDLYTNKDGSRAIAFENVTWDDYRTVS